jgi:hypothetical protein
VNVKIAAARGITDMADGPSIEDDILDNAGMAEPQQDAAPEPVYRMFEGAKIPVSKAHGKLWKSRRDYADKQRATVVGSWDECTRYFNNDQSMRDGADRQEKKGGRRKIETENLVFANASTLLPAIYSKNPKIDITVDQSDLEDPQNADQSVTELNNFARVLERLVNKLLSPQFINLKPKARRQALFAILTNYGWLKLNWNDKEFSSEAVLDELTSLATQYENAKDDKEIAEIEGKLIAIEQQFDVVDTAGPAVVVKNPKDILIDPACHDAGDLSTAMWVMEDDYLPTNFLRAKYMKKKEGEDSDQYEYLFKPTHTAQSAGNTDDTNGLHFIQWEGSNDADKDKFDDNYYTKVTYVWDKVTRRVFLYNEADWSWPLWVWEDPLRLSRFFPYFGLAFAPATTGVYGKGEINFYLDQQDAVNDINAQAAKVRSWAFNKFVYNQNVIPSTEVDKILKADGYAAVGVNLPEGMKIQDFWTPLLPPSAAHTEMFSKDDKYRVIDRLSAVTDAMRGTQFKTNTTNDAVQANMDAAKLRIGEKIDALEDMLADLGRAIAELCVSNYDKNDVAKILSQRDSQSWMEMTVQEFNQTLTATIVAGSTEKPTSAAKQQQALQTGQVLGQFAKSSPMISVVVMRMLERAFDNVIINHDDWEQLIKSLSPQGEQAGGQPPSTPGASQGSDPTQDPGLQGALVVLLKLLPPKVQQMIQESIQKGASPMQAIQAVGQHIGSQGAQQQ